MLFVLHLELALFLTGPHSNTESRPEGYMCGCAAGNLELSL